MPPKRSTNPKKKSRSQKAKKPVLSSKELFEAAQAALDYDDFDQARNCFQQCLKQAPDNLEYIDAYGAFLAEVGDVEEAVTVLKRSIQLSPDVGYEKYMYLGQLMEGEEALELVRTGISVLEKAVRAAEEAAASTSANDNQAAEDADAAMEEEARTDAEGSTSGRAAVAELKAQLGGALCSLAEMVMGSTGDPSSVAADVEGLLQRARIADARSPEPLQVLASLRYETGRPEEALASLKESMQLWFKEEAGSSSDDDEDEEDLVEEDLDADGMEELGIGAEPGTRSSAEGQEQETGGRGPREDEEEEAFVPSYEFRIETAKLLLELDDSSETAVQVLEDLLQENDTVPEVWHLLGYAFYGALMLDEAEEVAAQGAALAAKLGAGDEMVAMFEDLKCAIAEAKASLLAEPEPPGSKPS